MGDGNRDVLLGGAADERTKRKLENAMRANPAIEAMLAKLSPNDAERLARVISDPDETRRLLSTPQAKKLMEDLRKGKKQQ